MSLYIANKEQYHTKYNETRAYKSKILYEQDVYTLCDDARHVRQSLYGTKL